MNLHRILNAQKSAIPSLISADITMICKNHSVLRISNWADMKKIINIRVDSVCVVMTKKVLHLALND